MIKTHNLGFPRIGAKRELKFAIESYWKEKISRDELKTVGAELRMRHWQDQAGLELVPVGDFSFYDQVLDMSFTLGHLPERVEDFQDDALDNYFRIARGRSTRTSDEQVQCSGVAAGEMTKWFDTNYHYIVPEFTAATRFKLDASRLLGQIAEARKQGVTVKPVIIGPVSYLSIGKSKDESDCLTLLPELLPVYTELLEALAEQHVEWVQIDEPLLVTELDSDWKKAFQTAYDQLGDSRVKLLLTTYFGQLAENRELAVGLKVAGLHVDVINSGDDVEHIADLLPAPKVLSLGVIDGRNIWRSDLNAVLDRLEPLAARLGERLWIAPSCSLLHVPVDLASRRSIPRSRFGWRLPNRNSTN